MKGRRLQPTVINTSNDEPMLLGKLKGAGEFREELSEFARENFSGKVSKILIMLHTFA